MSDNYTSFKELCDQIAEICSPPAWHERARCRGMGHEMFFPGRGVQGHELTEFCGGCPVQQECYDDALSDPYRKGYWGGKSERHRLKEHGNVR